MRLREQQLSSCAVSLVRSDPVKLPPFCICLFDSGFEDDIVISYCLSQLVPEEALAADVDESR